MVNKEIAMPFTKAAYDFLALELGLQVTQGPVSSSGIQGTSQEVNIIIGITGAVSGQIIYSMSLNTAKSISTMMLGRQVKSLDHNAQSALCELGNMISGMATSRFDVRYVNVALTPPSLIAGNNVFISILKMGYMHTSFASEIGNLDVTIALRDNTAQQANAV